MSNTFTQNFNQVESLIDSACAGDTREVRRLLSRGLDPDTRDEHGFPILSLAAVGGHNETVKLLLQCGANIEATDADGNTPLRWAVDEGHSDVAQTLLENGAEIEVVNCDGFSPMYCALISQKFKLVNLLRVHLQIRGQIPSLLEGAVR